MKLIVGLGNPEAKYDNTFHNMGFNAVTDFAASRGLKFRRLDCRARIASARELIIAKPQTYMNLSGESVKGLLKKYKLEPCDMIVVYDDLDLEAGVIRIRGGGSGGTHNGMRNIISCIGRQDFPRLRIGIGRPQQDRDVADYVLSNIPKELYSVYEQVFSRVTAALSAFADGISIEKIMAEFNG